MSRFEHIRHGQNCILLVDSGCEFFSRHCHPISNGRVSSHVDRQSVYTSSPGRPGHSYTKWTSMGSTQLAIAMIDVTKSRTGNYDFCACAHARVSPVGRYSVGHIRFAVCAERSRDKNLRFLRKFHPDKIWNTLITITYLHIQIPYKSKTSFSSSFIF